MRRACAAPVLLSLMLGSTGVAAGQESLNADDNSRWEFVVAPYLLFPHMDGSVTIRRIPIGVDVSPSEVFESLDFGFMLYLEGHNRDWAVTLDGLYMNLGETGQIREEGRTAEVDMKQLALAATGLRRVAPWAEFGIGGRLNVLEAGLVVEEGVILPAIDESESKTWFDPLLAARFTVPLENSNWRLGVRGDIGGFGIGSDIAWQVYPLVGYRFSHLFEMALAYRWLGMEYETGSGDDLFVYDVVDFGPEIGFLFHF
jgi:hypothetical protein